MELGAVARLTLALIFALASVGKLGDVQAFADALRGYDFLPAVLTAPLARLIPLLEGAVAIALIAGYQLPIALSLAAALLATFALAGARALLHGRDIDCGCLGRTAALRIGWISVAANVALVTGAFIAISQRAMAVPLPRDAQSGNAAQIIVAWSLALLASVTYWLSIYAESVAKRLNEALTVGE